MTDCVLDKRQMRKSFAKAALSYDAMAVLQRQVGRALIPKVALAHDALLVDVGCGTGFFTQQLRETALLKNIFGLDIAFPMLLKTQDRLSTTPLLCADAEQLPFVSHCLDGLVSNLALQWCLEIESMFVEVRRVLKAKGQFVFSTFGERALYELKNAWAQVDEYPHVNEFCRLSEIKQQLQAAGFIDVQIESQLYLVKYRSVIELMRELKGIGAHNVSQARNRQLTTKGQLQALLEAYPKDIDGQITASYEVIFVRATTGSGSL